ncbi:PEP-CTERM sorting domain-containing protein [bacterium]|nr:MAG: PEP-CTERM sorting domain-containing protein [bacterium]
MTLLTRSFALSLALSAAALGSAQSLVRGFVGPETRQTSHPEGVIGASYSDHYDNSVAGGSFQASFKSARLNAVVNTVDKTGGGITSRVEIEDDFTVSGGEGLGVMYVNVRVHGDTGAAFYGDRETGGFASGSISFDMRTEAVDSYQGSYLDDYAFNWYKHSGANAYGTSHQEFALSSYYSAPDPTTYKTDEFDADAGYYRLPIKFRFNTPWHLSMSMAAWAENLNAGISTADFGNTFRWLGIHSFASVGSDGTLTPIANASIQSLSGTNYAEAVPEPASMLALGAGALALMRRRRK